MYVKDHNSGTLYSGIYQRQCSIPIAALFALIMIYSLRLSFSTEPVALSLHKVNSSNNTTHTKGHLQVPEHSIVSQNAAAIIETRPLEKLVPLLLHFSSVLRPAWPVILFTTQNSIPASAPLRRAIDEKRISIRFLPEETSFTSQHEVSQFLTSPWFWEQLAPAGHVLLFQADSILCSSSPLRVDDFLRYDFVGAPIDESFGHGEGFNGGLSLRNRSMVLDVVREHSWIDEFDSAEDQTIPWVEFEDQWFVHKMKMQGANFPPVEVARTFSVETIWYDTPLGYHQVGRWQEGRIEEVDAWCPEHRMASAELLVYKEVQDEAAEEEQGQDESQEENQTVTDASEAEQTAEKEV